MRQVTFIGNPRGTIEQKVDWLTQALRTVAEASTQNDPVTLANDYTIIGAFTVTRTLTPSTATAANLANFLATFITDLQKGGVHRTT